jgi:serine/threonine-protein kinase
MMPDGHSCVIDLGVARHIDKTSLTAVGFTWGTQGYMSPEQCQAAKQLTYRSDLFALGVIAIECSLGRHPTMLNQDTLLSMNYHICLPPPISSWGYSEIVKRMLNPSATKRPTPHEIQEYLTSFL